MKKCKVIKQKLELPIMDVSSFEDIMKVAIDNFHATHYQGTKVTTFNKWFKQFSSFVMKVENR